MCSRRRLAVLVIGLSILALSQASFGAGFAIYEGGARATAMGGAAMGSADDPSAIYYNPAGITQLEGFQIEVGATAIQPGTEVTTMTPVGPVKTESIDNWWVPPHAYATYGINDKVWAGMGIYSRFGFGSEFPNDWPGRYNSYEAIIQSLTFNPSVAVKLTDKLSVAAGVSAVWFDLTLKRMLPVMGSDIPFKLEGDSVGYGYNLAARYQILDWVSVGASYQSKVDESVDGTADAGILGSTDASGDITLPDFLMLGVSVKPMEKLGVEVGAVRTGWSSYDTLKIKFDDPTVLGMSESVSQKDWDDVWRYCIGFEYALTESLDLRAGYAYDQTPDPDNHTDYMIPTDDRHLYSVGAGYKLGEWAIDLCYTYIYIMDRDIPGDLAEGVLPSTFENGHAHGVALSLSTKL